MNKSFDTYANQYKNALLNDVIPFWEKHSIDREHGGYFTCLDRDGTVFDTDKFIWLQARQVWTFSMLCNRLEKRSHWLDIARHGADFLRKHGRAENGDWYFSLTQNGKPLVQPYSVFSDCFVTMALAQYALAADDAQAAEEALSTYRKILKRQDNPKGIYNKQVPDTRPLKSFAVPMILCNLTLELEHLLSPDETESAINNAVQAVMGDFVNKETNLVVEALADGHLVDSFEGRLMNPGHAIEAMWFIMEIAQARKDKTLIDKTIDVVLASLEYGWDEQYGGIFYFMDRLGKPPQQLEWDQKLWWVHLETLVALALGYSLSGREACLKWYEKVHNYSWNHFPDAEYGEWYGYLNRQGEVLLPLKGGKWKGCFHVPRSLYKCWQIFESLSLKENS